MTDGPETMWRFTAASLSAFILSIRMVAGFAEVIEGKDFLVAGARYVPNRQFLSIPFRSELIHTVG
jgi:hypothetical protein